MKKVTVQIFNKGNQPIPQYETINSAGVDLRADFTGKKKSEDFLGSGGYSYWEESEELTLFAKGGRVLIPTGLHIALPEGYELQIRPRSGLALKHGITIVNTPGTIDADYRGEIGVILINTDPHHSLVIKAGERICQAVIKKCEQIEWEVVKSQDDLGSTERGEGGFGHTGK